MTTPDASRRARHGFRLDQLPLERARLALYLICLGIAFMLYLLLHGSGAGIFFWLLAGAAIAGAAYGAMTDMARNGGILQAAVLLASLLTVIVPLGVAVAQNGKMGGAISAASLWPQILVLLFASRVLAELARASLLAAWRIHSRAASLRRCNRRRPRSSGRVLHAGVSIVRR